MFVLRANQPTLLTDSLAAAPHSLSRQSCGDRRGECHENGWGIGYFEKEVPCRIRSVRAAVADPRFLELATTLASPTILAHVRQASSGSVAERNSHPFLFGRWLFAHNGTLYGFREESKPLLQLIAPHLLSRIEGDTDSEHAFALLLTLLERRVGSLEIPIPVETVGAVLRETLDQLTRLYPGKDGERSEFNFALTDGRVMAAVRWGHTLFWLERSGPVAESADRPVNTTGEYRALAVASEPTSNEKWQELPDRTLLLLGHSWTPVLINL
jgi:glutamine amidotransferase